MLRQNFRHTAICSDLTHYGRMADKETSLPWRLPVLILRPKSRLISAGAIRHADVDFMSLTDTMTPSLTASEKLPLVGRSPPAAQDSNPWQRRDVGEELPDRHAAWKEATITAGQILQGLDGKLQPNRDWRMEVTDEFANPLFVINVSARNVP